jgi:Fe-S-cluster containining protein
MTTGFVSGEEAVGSYVVYKTCEFFLPFVCHRCGRCCEAPAPWRIASGTGAIADHLGVTVKELVRARFGGMAQIVNHDGHEMIERLAGWENHPCPFLTQDKRCEVYAVRPDGCRLFPLHTDFGPCGTECPGHKDFQRARKEFFKGRAYFKASYTTTGIRKPRTREWVFILRKLARAKVSDEMVRRFLTTNEVPPNLSEKVFGQAK